MERTNETAAGSERTFFKIASGASALALGVLLGAVASLHRDASGFSFRVSGVSLAGFAVGSCVGLVYWRIIAPGSGNSSPAWARAAASLLVLLVGVAAFVYPIRFISKDALPEVLAGLLAAAGALLTGAFLLWRIKGFLDRDTARGETENPAQPAKTSTGPRS